MALTDPRLSWAAGRGQEHEVIPDAGTAFERTWNRVRDELINFLLESLILAQDERWRRA